MTSTELSHGTFAINMLIDAMIKAVGDEYEVAEIEGDAVLLIRKGEAPSKKEILDICIKIFNAFHFQRKWMQQHAICPCGACLEINNLTLKFVVHHGPVAEIKVGRFVKQSGPEMIIAHRLLKNSINNNEYLLMSEKLLEQVPDPAGPADFEWISSSEEYGSIGRVGYRFTLLNEARKKCPAPPEPQTAYPTDNTPYLELIIGANYRDVYMVMMNIPGRAEWMPGLQKVEQEIPQVFVGSVHYCMFDEFRTIVSPLKMTYSPEKIFYAESCTIKELDLSLVHEFVFTKINEDSCHFAWRLLNASHTLIPEELNTALKEKMQMIAERLKEKCTNMEASLFEPAFRHN